MPGVNYTDGKPELYPTIIKPKKCFNCDANVFEPRFEYVNAIIIELRDADTFSDIDALRVVLFDEDTTDVHMHIGKRATVTGEIQCHKRTVFQKQIRSLFVGNNHKI
jgi:hypothetical protein